MRQCSVQKPSEKGTRCSLAERTIYPELSEPIKNGEQKEFFTSTEATKPLEISRAGIYRYMTDDTIKAVQFKRKTLIRRKDIDALFENPASHNKKLPKERAPVTDFYPIAEVKEKYNVKASWIFVVAKRHNLLRTFNRDKTYCSKKHIDNYSG